MAETAEKNGKKPVPRPLDAKYKLNDSKTSPILRTIYDSRRKSAHEQEKITDIRERDNTVFIAVNDQQPGILKKRAKSSGGAASDDEDPDVIKSGSRDAFDLPVDSSCGHVKFFTSAQVEFEKSPSMKAKVYSYLIQHSLPEFPNIPWSDEGSVRRFAFPTDPAAIFSENATKSFSKGQHFMCMSFVDDEILDPEPQRRYTSGPNLQLAYDRNQMDNYLKSKSKHFAVILHYLKTTHASVSSTNYDPHNWDFAVYHQYLNVFSKWSFSEYVESSDNQARTTVAYEAHGDSTHLCPLWPLHFKTKIDGRNQATTSENARKTKLHTMRSSQQSDYGPCRKWRPKFGARGNKYCISSGLLKTTNHQYQLESVLLMKNSMATIAPYDDIISPLVAPISDYAAARDNYVDEEHVETVDMTLIVQSWVDALTIPEMNRKLMRGRPDSPNQVGLQVNLKITNSAGIRLPEIAMNGQAGWKQMRSQNVDHSKWALSYPSGRAGTFPKLFCVSDLNRTFKHIKLDNNNAIERGRGGASICFSGGPLPELMYGLSPTLPDQMDGMFYDNLASLYAGFKQSMATVVGYSTDGRSLYLMNQLESRPNVVTIFNYSSPILGAPGQNVPSLPLLESADGDYLKIEGDVEFDAEIIEVANDLDVKERKSLLKFNRSKFNIGSIFSHPFTQWDSALLNERAPSIYKIGFGFWFRLQESFEFTKDALLNLPLTKEWYQKIIQFLPKKKELKPALLEKKTLAVSRDRKPFGVIQKGSINRTAKAPSIMSDQAPTSKPAFALPTDKGKQASRPADADVRKPTLPKQVSRPVDTDARKQTLPTVKGKQVDTGSSSEDAENAPENLKGKTVRPVSTPPRRADVPNAPKINRFIKTEGIAFASARRKLFDDDLMASDASASEEEIVSSKSKGQTQYSDDNVPLFGSSDEENLLAIAKKTQKGKQERFDEYD